MSLSFREQVAMAFYTRPATKREEAMGEIDSVDLAQVLADQCCKQWGHDDQMPLRNEPSFPPGRDPHTPSRCKTCRRCGKETTP